MWQPESAFANIHSFLTKVTATFEISHQGRPGHSQYLKINRKTAAFATEDPLQLPK